MSNDRERHGIDQTPEENADLAYALQYLTGKILDGEDVDVAAFVSDNRISWDAIRKKDLDEKMLAERNKNMLHTAMGLGAILNTYDSGDIPRERYLKFCGTVRGMDPELRQYARYCIRHCDSLDVQTRRLFGFPTDATLSQVSFLLMEQDISIPPK